MSEAKHLAIEISMPAGSTAESEDTDRLSGLLFELGALGIELRDASEPMVVVAAFTGEASGALEDEVRSALEGEGLAFEAVRCRAFEAVDWSTQWRQGLGPLRFGTLWIVPSWLEVPEGAEHVLRIDPSMAFGTGLHETTALCMERVVELSPMASILDFGTGSGILALAALALGAERAVGLDNDPEALEIALENAENNGYGDRLTLAETSVEQLQERFPVVVANILAGTLIDLAPAIASRVADRGTLLLSGILIPQADGVRAAYEAEGLEHGRTETRGEWAMIEMKRGGGLDTR